MRALFNFFAFVNIYNRTFYNGIVSLFDEIFHTDFSRWGRLYLSIYQGVDWQAFVEDHRSANFGSDGGIGDRFC